MEKEKQRKKERKTGILGELILSADGASNGRVIATDQTWKVSQGPVRFSEIYDGESFDATFVSDKVEEVCEFSWPIETLIPQQGEQIREMERVCAREIIHTPAGEWVVDFGQNITGYVEFTVDAHEGEQDRKSVV